MKINRNLFLIIAILFVVAACKKDALVSVDSSGNTVGNGGAGGSGGTGGTSATSAVKVKTAPYTGVYLVGYKATRDFPLDPKPTLWKNNNPLLLGYFEGVANAVCAQDTNILAVGTEVISKGTNAVYWYKNYIIRLTYNDFYGGRSTAVGIAVSGKDVYITGIHGGRPVYWKNGEITLLSSGSSNDRVTGIVIKGDDIYISGACYSGTLFPHIVACYWKNGVLHSTDDNVWESVATGIAVDDNGNVLLCGYARGSANPRLATPVKPVYWKNNTITALPMDMTNATAYGIAVNGNNIYISGTADDNKGNTKGVVWTNGKLAYLPNSLSAKAIFAIKDEVYVAGTRPIDALTTYGVVWKGNNIIAQGSLTSFNGICVVK